MNSLRVSTSTPEKNEDSKSYLVGYFEGEMENVGESASEAAHCYSTEFSCQVLRFETLVFYLLHNPSSSIVRVIVLGEI